MTVLGAGALIIQSYDRSVEVVGYDPQQGSLQTFEMVSGILAFDHLRDGQVYHLVLHQAIHMPQLDHHLLCPMQCCINDVTVNDVPKFLTCFPTNNTHALIVQNPDDDSTTLCFPLHLQGVTLYLPVCKPTATKWETGDIVRIDMTAENLDWDPNDPTYTSQEADMTDYRGVVLPRLDRGQPFVINALSSMTTDAADITDDEIFGVALEQHVTVSVAALDTTKTAPGQIHSKDGKPVDAEMLAKCWLIPANRTARTVDRTTQQGVCTMLNPTLSCRFPTNDRMLHYPVCPTLSSATQCLLGWNQRIATSVVKSLPPILVGHPLKQKGKAHEALSLMFKPDGVPPEMILDGLKEQVEGAFRRKLKEVNCHLHVTEPYSPWQQAAEGCICELKQGVSRKMIKTGAPKCLWDHCIKLEGLICSHTTNDIYATGGEVPETILKGGTADISPICKFAWYDWVMFRNTVNTIAFPDNRLTLGKYLGPANDIGSALTAKILKQNGQYVCRSTLRHLTPEETLCKVQIAAWLHFDNMITKCIGPKPVPGDFPAKDLTPEYEHYCGHTIEEDTANAYEEGLPDNNDLDPLPTLEAGDNYISAEVLLPLGSILRQGTVISCKCNADCNTVGRAHDQPILDTRTYDVEFDDGTIAKLTANKIAKCMYAQCDPGGNQYVLLDCFVDFDKSSTAISLADQNIIMKGRPSKRCNTYGWMICCQWKDGSTTWESLNDLKESHPLEMAEYAVTQGIDHEPMFNWWVPQVLLLRNCIISLVKKWKMSYLEKNLKFGIEVPTSVDHALKIDRHNGNTL